MPDGYVENLDVSREAFDSKWWYDAGDVCRISPEGYLQVVGRTEGLINYNGFQVSPTELEVYLMSRPAVTDAAVGEGLNAARVTNCLGLMLC